jgi:uncharacterized protein DUF4383
MDAVHHERSAVTTRTPAQLYALVVGAVLAAAGVLGFFYSADFGTPGATSPVLGILDVNGWHNVVHLATGLLGLAMMASPASARAYAFLLGVVYLVVAVWGFALGGDGVILSVLPVNAADDVLHLALGVLGLAAGAASGPSPAPAARA